MKRLLSLMLACLLLILPVLSFAGCPAQEPQSEREKAFADALALIETMNTDTRYSFKPLDACGYYTFRDYVYYTESFAAPSMPIEPELFALYNGNSPYCRFYPFDDYHCHKSYITQYQFGIETTPQLAYTRGEKITLYETKMFEDITGDDTRYITAIATTDPNCGFWGVSPCAMLETATAALTAHGFRESTTLKKVYVATRPRDGGENDYVNYMVWSLDVYDMTEEQCLEEYLSFYGEEYPEDAYITEIVTDYTVRFYSTYISIELRYNSDGMITHMVTSVHLPKIPSESDEPVIY